MKNYLLILLLALTTNVVFSQDKDPSYSTIYFVRSGNFFGSACKSDIIFPNQREFNLSLKSVVQYKIYSEGETNITLQIACPGTQQNVAMSESKQVTLDVKRGNEYYVFYNVGSFRVVEKPEVEKFIKKTKNVMKHEENMDNPINKASIKDVAQR